MTDRYAIVPIIGHLGFADLALYVPTVPFPEPKVGFPKRWSEDNHNL